jgi:primosomal protein N''
MIQIPLLGQQRLRVLFSTLPTQTPDNTSSGNHSAYKLSSPFQPTHDVLDIQFSGQTVEQRARRFSRYHGNKLYTLGLDTHKTRWDVFTQAPEASEEKLAIRFERFLTACHNTQAYNTLNELLEPENLSQIKNPRTRKHLEVLKADYLKPQATSGLPALEARIDAKGAELNGLLSEYGNFGPDDLPEGQHQSYAVQLLDLVRERNDFARLQGFDNYYDFRLSKQGISGKALDQYLARMTCKLDELSQRMKRIELDKTDLIDLDEFIRGLELDPVDIARKTTDLMGKTAILDKVLAKSDLFEDPDRPRKSGNALAYPLDPPDDVRALANWPRNPRNVDFFLLQEFLHEVIGHGVSDSLVDRSLPPQLKQFDNIAAEGLGLQFEQQLYNPKFLTEVLKLEPKQVKDLKKSLALQQWNNLVPRMRDMIRVIQVERELYKNPEQDLDKLYDKWRSWQLQRSHYNSYPGSWAGKNHYAVMPAYCHTYLFAQTWGAQVDAAMQRKHGNFLSPTAWKELEKILSEGKMLSWKEQMRLLTADTAEIERTLPKIGASDWEEQLKGLKNGEKFSPKALFETMEKLIAELERN